MPQGILRAMMPLAILFVITDDFAVSSLENFDLKRFVFQV